MLKKGVVEAFSNIILQFLSSFETVHLSTTISPKIVSFKDNITRGWKFYRIEMMDVFYQVESNYLRIERVLAPWEIVLST